MEKHKKAPGVFPGYIWELWKGVGKCLYTIQEHEVGLSGSKSNFQSKTSGFVRINSSWLWTGAPKRPKELFTHVT